VTISTGIGSVPGEDPRRANSLITDLFPDLPFLGELPARGVGADLIGRTTALLADLHVDLQPSGWRFVDRAGGDERRAKSMLAEDLDAFEEALSGFVGPVKVQATGPWTLAASLATSRGGLVLADKGACRDLTQSLVEGLAHHTAELRKRMPLATQIYLQIDEPLLPQVANGAITTASGLGQIRTPPRSEMLETLSALSAIGDQYVVHCCAPGLDLDLLREASVGLVSLDYQYFAINEAWGRWIEDGRGAWFGVVPAVDAPLPGASATVGDMQQRITSLGFDLARLAPKIGVTATCGYAGASEDHLRASAKRLAEIVVAIGESS